MLPSQVTRVHELCPQGHWKAFTQQTGPGLSNFGSHVLRTASGSGLQLPVSALRVHGSKPFKIRSPYFLDLQRLFQRKLLHLGLYISLFLIGFCKPMTWWGSRIGYRLPDAQVIKSFALGWRNLLHRQPARATSTKGSKKRGWVAINIQSTWNLGNLRRYDRLRLDNDWGCYLLNDYEKKSYNTPKWDITWGHDMTIRGFLTLKLIHPNLLSEKWLYSFRYGAHWWHPVVTCGWMSRVSKRCT